MCRPGTMGLRTPRRRHDSRGRGPMSAPSANAVRSTSARACVRCALSKEVPSRSRRQRGPSCSCGRPGLCCARASARAATRVPAYAAAGYACRSVAHFVPDTGAVVRRSLCARRVGALALAGGGPGRDVTLDRVCRDIGALRCTAHGLVRLRVRRLARRVGDHTIERAVLAARTVA
jgi:hypothetical protein